MDIVQVITGFILGLGIIAPFFLKARAIVAQVKDLLVEISKSLEDGSISTAEAVEVLKEIKELVDVVKK
jgi:hypothetical protein